MTSRAIWRRPLETIAAVGAFCLAWDLYVRWTDAPSYLLPPPADVGAALIQSAASGELAHHLLYTLQNLILGYGAGALLGVAAGVALAKSPRLDRALGGPILFLQTAPKIALAPLFVIWFGLGLASKIALIISLVFFPVLVGTMVGLRSLDSRFADLARLLRLGVWRRLWLIELRAGLPDIFVGLRIGAVQAVVGAILGEWMSGRQGLGYLMTFASATYKTPLLFGAVVLTALLGIAVYQLVETAERRLLSWRDAP
ncbi:MAG: ABC transporter permease [Rhizobiales bacterium 65-9]|nr:ABC transporter permease [Hyphomicrobiales bacterium]OJY37298.1 MAG: ABC transporter permease [Rhizobiales bacterium 65-9]